MMIGFDFKSEDGYVWFERRSYLPSYYWMFKDDVPHGTGCCLTFIYAR